MDGTAAGPSFRREPGTRMQRKGENLGCFSSLWLSVAFEQFPVFYIVLFLTASMKVVVVSSSVYWSWPSCMSSTLINDDGDVMLVPNGVLYPDITMSLVLPFCCSILELLLSSRRDTFFARNRKC
ncbi:hypothetical protein D5086_028279 [Populus alba]|uniref:Uncharacterized protein n=1 Tax=Populus alba TaxID=43335 RepID=A0ACC4AXQ8_POPAL